MQRATPHPALRATFPSRAGEGERATALRAAETIGRPLGSAAFLDRPAALRRPRSASETARAEARVGDRVKCDLNALSSAWKAAALPLSYTRAGASSASRP